MLFVPFAVFLLNNAFVHAEVYDKVYPSFDVCIHEVAAAVASANKEAPKGGRIKGGCLPLGEDVKGVAPPPTEATEPCEGCKEL